VQAELGAGAVIVSGGSTAPPPPGQDTGELVVIVFGFCVKVDIELGDAVFIVAAVFQVNGRLGANVGSLKSLKRWIVKTVRMANTLAR